MKLHIDGRECELIDIKLFRQQYNLPEDFTISIFEKKDYEGLATIEHAGNEMNRLRQTLLDLIPTQLSLQHLLSFASELSEKFQTELYAINSMVNLKDVEIDYAVSGFHDVCQSLVYAVIRANTQKHPLPPFTAIYVQWLNDSIRLSQSIHEYEHKNNKWQIQTINTAYGRIGLRVTMNEETLYIRDNKLACPAEGFMYTLLNDIAQKIISALPTSEK